jgi:HAD superfamily hydrolase (TIGR01459 family)
MTIERIEGLAAIADRYGLFLVDQWGVLHNGETAHDGAVETLRGLRAAGKKIVILSNSSKRTAVTTQRMAAMGFDASCYDHCVTSGEEVWQALSACRDPFYAALGRRCFVFTWDNDKRLFEDLDLIEVDHVADADFILNIGTQSGLPDAAVYDVILREAAARDLPMICANPDFVSVAPDGGLAICPGTTARRYEELGGRVDYRGKPHAPVYRACFAFEPDCGPAVAIGDSLHHDIGGANGAGIDSVLIAGGIHANELAAADGGCIDGARLDALCKSEGQTPTYVMSRFGW